MVNGSNMIFSAWIHIPHRSRAGLGVGLAQTNPAITMQSGSSTDSQDDAANDAKQTEVDEGRDEYTE